MGYDLYTENFGQPNLAPAPLIRSLLQDAARLVEGHGFALQFLQNEWGDVVDAWHLKTWEEYRDVSRLGRRTRIGGKQREVLWQIFSHVRQRLNERNVVTWSDVFGRMADVLASEHRRPFDFAVVDEAQDLSVSESRFLAAMAGANTNGLFFAGDLGQRIFQQPFSWRALGLDVRGRSFTLRINYRTSHQIRAQADRLLPTSVSDMDGLSDSRRGTVSIFDGPAPSTLVFDREEDEIAAVADWINDQIKRGVDLGEIGLFVRSEAQLKRARSAVKAAGQEAVELSDKIETDANRIAIATMHYAKGLEFKSVVVMACDEEVVPLQTRIETVTDEADLKEVYETERHLLYVACTRARDRLLVTAVDPASEFLDDFGG